MKYQMPFSIDKPRLYAAVAKLPCQCPWECRRYGVEVSHSNQYRDGKGKGMKAHPWMVAALYPDCHRRIDNYIDLTREESHAAWDHAHRRTVSELFRLGWIRPIEKAFP